MPDQSAMWWDAAAIFVALCALYLTIQSNKATREHNRLSVRPRLTTSTSREQVTDGPTVMLDIRVTLSNVGLGPAVIKGAEILLDGQVAPAESFEDLRPLLERVFPGIQLGPTSSFMKLNLEHAIAVGEQVEIVAFQVVNPPISIDAELKRFNLRIRCESLYGDPCNYDSRGHLKT